MTRQDFLQNKWRPFPAIPERIDDNLWVFGKILHLTQNSLVLDASSELLLNTQECVDPYWGYSCPPALLQVGDFIVYSLKHKAAYLLAPGEPLLESQTERRDWQQFLQYVNDFFLQQGFLHWHTPNLLFSSGIDAHIDFMKVQGIRTGKEWSLPTSPEFALKKAMVCGEQKIFEIKNCFRDDDPSPHHRSEFTMVEWYRAYTNKWTLLADFAQLLTYLQNKMNLQIPPLKIERKSLPELFKEHVQMELLPTTAKAELQTQAQKLGIETSPSDDWDDVFFRLFLHCVEPQLEGENPIAVYDYPSTQASLSRVTTEGWCDRFEIYWQGVELANAYQEQNDPQRIEAKYYSEVHKRKKLGRVPHALDESFLTAMQKGFPPSAGIALGLDRLYMILRGKKELLQL